MNNGIDCGIGIYLMEYSSGLNKKDPVLDAIHHILTNWYDGDIIE